MADGEDLIKAADIIAQRDETARRLRGTAEVEALTSTLDVYDLNSIVTFGAGAADRISEAADRALHSATQSADQQGGALMQSLSDMLASFDPNEAEKGPTFLGRLFGSADKALDRLIDRYTQLGREVDAIYTRLRSYEADIAASNEALEGLYDANEKALTELEKYIVAGEQGIAEIEAYKAQVETQPARPERSFEVNSLDQALNALKGRVHDLRLCEAVALQALPTVRLMEHNNAALQRKIDASLIVTLPVFRQALAQAIMLKKQKTQSDAIRALEKRTADVLKKSGRSADALKGALAGLQGGQTDMNSAFEALRNGLTDTRKLQDEAKASREENEKRLEALKAAWEATAQPIG